MKAFERSKLTKYRWWREDWDEVVPDHVKELEKHAAERIADLLEQGFTEGELKIEISSGSSASVSYVGWWEHREIASV